MGFEQVIELASHIAVIAASVVAILGVSAWKREFKGKRDMELAEDVLCLFYRAERAIKAIRSPLGYLGEGQTRKPEAGETPEQKAAKDDAYAVLKRISDRGDIFGPLFTLRFRFMARLGRDKAKPFDEMKCIVDEICVSAQQLAQLWANRVQHSISPETEAQIKKEEAVIWYAGAKDQIEPRVKSIIEEIEAKCRLIIEGK